MENLLVWSRQQLAGIHVNPAKINIKNRVADIFEDHSFQAKQKQISLINDIPGDLQMETDPDLLKLILRNLINNGIKFSNIGDKITVTCCRKGNFATFKVMDNGIGIPAQQQKELLKASLKSRRGTGNEKGMGLGLNLCKEFVDMQGGRLSFESTEGKGTTFIFTLPASS